MMVARRPRRSRRRGYVLIMVLLLLTMGATVLAATARLSLRRTTAARLEIESLQRRWACRSIERVLLPEAHVLLTSRRGQSVARRSTSLTLGGQQFEVTIADEQSKLNVNGMLAWFGGGRTMPAVAELVGSTPSRLRPQLPAAGRRRMTSNDEAAGQLSAEQEEDEPDIDRAAPRVGSLGELFPGAPPAELFGNDTAPLPADVLTCWGNGMVSFRSAPRAVLLQACNGVLRPDQVDELMDLRAKDPEGGLDAILDHFGRNDPLNPLRRRLIDDSFCHSIRITVRTPSGRRYDVLSVRDETTGTRPMFWHFDLAP